MIVTLEQGADLGVVRQALTELGLWVRPFRGEGACHLWVEAHSASVDAGEVRAIPGVVQVAEPESSHPRVDAASSVVCVGDVSIGLGAGLVIMAGPCSVESEASLYEDAGRLSSMGVSFLRGGAFKPRTSPYAFQGHGARALEWLRGAADSVGMKVVTEVMSPEDVPLVATYTDMLQVGSRNMHSYALLRAVGAGGLPVLLKRGMSATVEEWLLAAEYLYLHGAPGVVFCERGVRGFDPSTRNLLDLSSVALLAHVNRVPVVVDPSHAVGRRDLIPAMARAAVAAGASGLMVETHAQPGLAKSDGPQALLPADLAALLRQLGVGGVEPRGAPLRQPELGGSW